MTRLEQIEDTVRNLKADDFRKFSSWFKKLKEERFDARIEKDSESGALDHLADKALANFRFSRADYDNILK